MRYLAAVVACILGASAVYAGPREDCYTASDPDAKIRACSEMIRTDARQRPVYYTLRSMAFVFRGGGYMAKGDTQRGQADLKNAAADLGEVVKFNPRNPDTYHGRGLLYEMAGEHDRAIADFSQVIKLSPRSAKGYASRGKAYGLKGDADRALTDLNTALRLDAGDVNSLILRAGVYLAKGDQARAMVDAERAVSLNAGNAAAYTIRGAISLAQNEFDRALADAETAVKLNPGDPSGYTLRGAALVAQGEYDRAIADFDAAIGRNPGNYLAYNGRGTAYHQKAEYSRAIADYTMSIKLNPHEPVAFANRGEANGDVGDHDRGIADLDTAIRINPRLATAYAYRGEIYRRKGDLVRALADHEQAVRLDANEIEVLFNRGRTYQAMGEREKALADYRHTLALTAKTAWLRKRQNDASAQIAALQPSRPAPAVSTLLEAPKPAAATTASGTTAPGAAPLGRRVALVIGNAAYKMGPLQNPGTDAAAVAEALEKDLKFDKVLVRRDLSYGGFREALRDLSREAAGADLGLVYFAGHGTEVGGRNYLVPVDATLARASDLELEAVALDTVLSQLEGVRKLKIVILDACRNNIFPLAGSKRSVGSRGLGRIEPEDNTLVVYAAKHGTTADDGAGRQHSPFTEALLKYVTKPDIEVRQLFGYVRDDVMAMTGRVQQPYTYGTLGGQPLFLNVRR